MRKEIISTSNAPRAIGPYSQAVRAGEMIFVSGQLPINPQTGELQSEIEAATMLSLENIKAILEEAGSSMSNILKVVVFLSDMNNFAAFNKVYGTYFPENPPARSTIQVARLPKDALLEIEATALVK
jgi:2-iminobutanoate/2-iminopropanoate deaminase